MENENATLIIMGGQHKSYSIGTVHLYHLNNGSITWSKQAADSPIVASRAGRAVNGGVLYITGGRIMKDGITYYTYGVGKYSLNKNMWEVLPNMTSHTYFSPILFIHGMTLYSAYNRQMYSLDLNNDNSSWIQESVTLPYKVFGPYSYVNVGRRVFIFGEAREYSNKVMSWVPGLEHDWMPLTEMNTSRNQHGSCAVSDGLENIWILAGCRNCWKSGFMEHYNVQSDTWTSLDALPDLNYKNKDALYAQMCEFSQGFIYVLFSGHFEHDLDPWFHIYNVQDGSWTRSNTRVKVEAYLSVSAVITK